MIDELAALASATGRIDRAVLRELRLLLPAADAATEAELWFSRRIARRSVHEIALRTAELDGLRDRLVASGRAPEALAAVARVHATAPPLLRLEDELIRIALRGAPRDDIERALGAAIETLREVESRSLDIASWALHALPRLPRTVRDCAAAWSLAFVAEARTGYAIALGNRPPEGIALFEVRGERLRRAAIRVAREPSGIVFGDVDGPAVEVAATTPRIVRIASQLVAVPAQGKSEPIEVPPGAFEIGELTGRRWRIEPIEDRRVQVPVIRYAVVSSPRFGFGELLEDIRRDVGEPLHALVIVGPLLVERWYEDALEAMLAHAEAVFARTPIVVVPGRSDFALRKADREQLAAELEARPLGEAAVPELAQTSALRGVLPRLFGRAAWSEQRFGALLGDVALTIPVGDVQVGIVGLNTALVPPGGGDVWRQLAVLCGDRVDWANRHDVTLLVVDERAWAHPAQVRDVADYVVVAGPDRAHYRRCTITLGDEYIHTSEMRLSGPEGFQQLGEPIVERDRRLRRDRGHRARAVRTVVDGLRDRTSYLVVGPPGVGLDWFVNAVCERLGIGKPIPYDSERSWVSPAVFAPILSIGALLRFRNRRRDNLGAMFLAAVEPVPFDIEDLANELHAAIFYLGDFDRDDIVDALPEASEADHDQLLDLTSGHGEWTLDVINDVEVDPPELVDLDQLRDVATLLAYARGRATGARIPADLGSWQLWRAGVIEHRRRSWMRAISRARIGAALRALVPESRPNRRVLISAPGEPRDPRFADELAAWLAVSGWRVDASGESAFLRRLAAAFAVLRSDPVHPIISIGTHVGFDLEIMVGEGARLGPRTTPLVVLTGDGDAAEVARAMHTVEGTRPTDSILDAIGVLAPEGVLTLWSAGGVSAANRLVTSRRISITHDEADQLVRLGAVVDRRAEPPDRGFASGLISEKSLDQVILEYLSEDVDDK